MDIPSSQSHESQSFRRVRPTTKLQTSFLPTINFSTEVPNSAVSSSSFTSSLQQSPIMSPQVCQLITTDSSVQASPEGPRGRDATTESSPTPFELPESIVSHRLSHSAMSEAFVGSKPSGLMRRISNKASKFTGRRRQSSNASRDHSSGPVIMRRRSDSTSTVPDSVRPSLYLDSDGEVSHDLNYGEDLMDGVTPVSTNTYANGLTDGPVFPFVLLQGTIMTKITKKKRKNLTFILDIESAKVSWDKNKPSKCFYIDDIKEIRCGLEARNYRQEFRVDLKDEAKFFSIVYAVPDKSKERATKIMHLIAGDEQTCQSWTSTLDAISKHRHDFMVSLSSFNDKAVKVYWQREMIKKFGDVPHSPEEEEIDLVGVERLCRSMHINTSANYLRSRFKEADLTQTGRLSFAEFQGFVRLMKQREDVRAIYRGITATPERGVSLEEFIYFLRDSQNENVDQNRSHWENVFAKFVRRSRPKDQQQQLLLLDDDEPRMSEHGLTRFLTSTYNVPIADMPSQLSFDRPLNEYFISSSHNTYLLGRQVAGQSSVEAYITALLRGCRCVEVDCWNGPQGPVVMHGRTLTSQVSFIDVMSTIRKYAFVKTNFPLWISLEVHCNAVQQAEMARIIRETCGDSLVTEPLDANASTLPTPMDLLNRILIKVKRPHVKKKPAEAEMSSGRRRGNSLTNTMTSPFLRPVQEDSLSQPPQSPLSPQHRLNRMMSNRQMRIAAISEVADSTSSSTSDSDSLSEEIKIGEDFPANQKKTSKIVPVLGELGVYAAGQKFLGFESPEAKSYNHIFSFMEQTFAKHSKNTGDRHALIMHNVRYMMRVYPNGWRLASTNFDPLTYWRRGVQMAALNWQTYDLGMQINDAMFAAGSDQTGYVLKPAELRGPIILAAESMPNGLVKKSRKNVSFEVDVISAQQLMRPKSLGSNHSFDPYVEVEVYHADDKGKESKGVVGEGGLDASGRDGPSGLGVPHRRRTQIVEGNGFNPVFDKKFVFNLTTKYPDLVFIRFSVRNSPGGKDYSDRGPPLATYSIKLGSIKQGYRTIPLMDANGDQFLFSTLFCRIKIDTPTTTFLEDAEAPSSIGVLKSLGRKLAGNPMSPKSSMEND